MLKVVKFFERLGEIDNGILDNKPRASITHRLKLYKQK